MKAALFLRIAASAVCTAALGGCAALDPVSWALYIASEASGPSPAEVAMQREQELDSLRANTCATLARLQEMQLHSLRTASSEGQRRTHKHLVGNYQRVMAEKRCGQAREEPLSDTPAMLQAPYQPKPPAPLAKAAASSTARSASAAWDSIGTAPPSTLSEAQRVRPAAAAQTPASAAVQLPNSAWDSFESRLK